MKRLVLGLTDHEAEMLDLMVEDVLREFNGDDVRGFGYTD